MSKIIDIHESARDGNKVRCGDCAHFRGVPNPSVADVPCSQNGVLASKMAPPCYTADVSALRPIGMDALRGLHSALASMTPKQMRIFSGLLGNGSSLERRGLTFLEEVFFTTDQGAPESLEGLYRGFALSSMPDGKVAIVGGSFLEGRNNACYAVLYRTSLLNRKQFDALVKKLSREGKVFTQVRPEKSGLAFSEEDIPTMDTSIEEMEKRAKRGGKRKVAKVEEDAPVVKRSRGRPQKTDPTAPRSEGRTLFSIK